VKRALGAVSRTGTDEGPTRLRFLAIEELRADYARDERGLQLIEVAGGWQITTRPEHNDWVRELLDPKTPTRLSIQALETLAVMAYRQPATLPEIIDLRGGTAASPDDPSCPSPLRPRRRLQFAGSTGLGRGVEERAATCRPGGALAGRGARRDC